MSEQVRQFTGLFFWALIIALVALNANAFSVVIGAISSLYTNVSRSLLVTTDPQGRAIHP